VSEHDGPPERKFYRAYCLGADGHIQRVEVIEADGDDDAMRAAQKLDNVYGIEVWDQARLVGRFLG
jgi:hypothetical protein